MSDQVENILAGLRDDEPTTPQTPATAPQKPRKARRPKTVEVASTEQRGARNDPNYTQLATTVRKDLRASLWFYLKREGKTMSSLIEELLEDWVEEQGGVIESPPPKKTRARKAKG
jgi:hypothetical protein